MAISKKMAGFSESSSWIRKMFEEGTRMKAKFGAEAVCDFSLGNPDLPPPPQFKPALAKVCKAEKPGVHAYMPNGGYPDVREAVARQIGLEQEVSLSGEELLMTCGAAGGLNVVLKSLLDPGDEVIILAPFFVEYHFYIDNHNGVPKVVATNEDFSLDIAAIEAEITPKTKSVIINSPNNPTGQIYCEQELTALGDMLSRVGESLGSSIYLISDEPYRKLVFEGHTVPSIFRAYVNSIIVSSYSKDLSLPGERIGYVVVHPEIADKGSLMGAMILANRILGFVNAPAFMQRVALQLQGATVDCGIYEQRRQLFCAILKEAGYTFVPPKGAFYLFPKAPIEDDVAFVSLLQDEKILAVPGRGFGMPGFFRLAFCVDDSVIERSRPGFERAMQRAIS